MKKKPDLSGFQRPALVKDPTEFLESGAADRAEKAAPVHQPEKPTRRGTEKAKVVETPAVQKIFRLPTDVTNALKLHVAQQTATTGRRVTETEVVEELLRKFLKLSR